MAAPLMADTELGHLHHRAAVLESQKEIVRAQINALLHRAPDAPIPAAPEQLELAPLDEIVERPDIGKLEAHVAAARSMEASSRLRGLPRFQIGTLYSSMWPMATHRWMVSVGLSVPLHFRANKARVDAAEATRSQMEAKLAAGRDRAAVEHFVASRQLAEEERIIEIFEEHVLPSARNRVSAARSGFETGRSSFIDIIDAQRILLKDELAYQEALAARFQRHADLARARGQIGVRP